MSTFNRLVLTRSTGVSDCPFLYQTRTILQKASKRRQARLLSSTATSCKQQTSPEVSKDEIFASQDNEPTSFLKQKAAEVASSKPKLGRSLTSAEQAAFDSIRKLFKKSPPSTAKARATSTDHTDTDYRNILDLFKSIPKDPTETDSSPFSQQTTDGHGSRSAGSSIGTKSTQKEHTPFETQTETIPLETSKPDREVAMAEIQGFFEESVSSSNLDSPSNSEVTTQSAALSIVHDVADSLTTALASQDLRPDIAMWRVAEEKVFPLIQLLRPSTSTLSSPTPAQSISNSASQHETTQDQSGPQPLQQPHSLIPSNLPLLPVLSQAYPSLTLLILRLYATHHPTSPYALALLPTLKSLGPTSYVLGAHTHFYNTLLLLYWRIYSDLRAMNKLLTEMEANGIEFDVGTWETLKAIGEDRQKDLNGHGERGRRWWNGLEQRNWWPRVGIEWREVVKRGLEEKGLLTGEVMREEAAPLGSLEDRDRPDYVVTL